MTFYGLEKPIEYGRQLIFDPSTAQMVLDALRQYAAAVYNDYQQGLLEMKEFRKEYGDFMTPILADLNWYNTNVTGKIRDLLNDAYANGVDLTRSPLGRAMVSLIINNIPYGEIAKMRLSAENAKQYLKARAELISKGLYDPSFEEFRLKGNTIENWDTYKKGAWNETSPSLFKDMNTWTHHLFDNMELSYDPELSKKYPGFMAYTKSRDTMSKIVDNNIAQLLNTDLGKYYLQDALNSIPEDFLGDRKKEALRRLKENVINSNWEEGQVELKANPYKLESYKHRLSGSGRTQKPDASYNYLTGVFARGVSVPFGYNPATQTEQAVNNMVKNQYTFGLLLATNIPMGPWEAYKSKLGAYVNKFTTYESPSMFASSIGRQAMNKNGAVYMSPEDVKLLRSADDIVTHTYGYTNRPLSTNTKNIPTPVVKIKDIDGETMMYSNIILQPYRDVYTAYMKRGAIDSQWKVLLQEAETGKVLGDYYFPLPMSSEANADVPRINEWVKGTDGNYYPPKDSKGNVRGVPKIGVDPRVSGQYETSSLETDKHLGVTKNDFDRNGSFSEEAISNPYPYIIVNP